MLSLRHIISFSSSNNEDYYFEKIEKSESRKLRGMYIAEKQRTPVFSTGGETGLKFRVDGSIPA